jgi:signal transduction histidine kinase
MKRRQWALWVSASAAALSVMAAIGLGVDSLHRQEIVAEGQSRAGATVRLLTLQRDLSALRAAAATGSTEQTVGRFSDLRGNLGMALAAEATTGRLPPQDIEFLARLARDLDALIVSGALQGGDIERDGALDTHAETLAAMTAALQASAADGGSPRTEGVVAVRTLQSLIAMAAALGLGAVSIVLRGGGGVDPTVLQAQRAAIEEAARLSKARFIMMMSHELRTPLNGLLGLLSIMKETDPPESMRPLLAQAERAGTQLTGMLGDMLEMESRALSGRDPAEAVAAPAVFSPDNLAKAMQDLYAPVSRAGGPSFRAETKGQVPEAVSGDGVRFQRAVSHLCNHVMETAGVEDVALEVSHEDGECKAALSFAHKAGPEAGMRLVEPAAGTPEAGDDITGVGLGPLLAKGLLEQMGGRLEVATLDSGRIMLLAATPAPAIEHDGPRVRIMAQTRSLDALSVAAAAAAGVEVLANDTAPVPDIVLVEAGGEEEGRAVAEARTLWPSAYLMALGIADDPTLFEDTIVPPLEPARVAEAVARAWQHCQHAAKNVSGNAPVLRAG